MPQEELYELLGDLPSPSTEASFDLKSGMKPAPLNFSRPRPRIILSDDDTNVEPQPVQSPAEYTAGPKFPNLDTSRRNSDDTIQQKYEEDEEEEEETEEEEEDDDGDSFLDRDISHTQTSNFAKLGIHDRNQNDSDSDEAAPPPVVRTHSRSTELHNQYNPANQRNAGATPGTTWIYKPYATSTPARRDSDDSSILSAITEVTDDDASSIAESVDTSYSSVSDFAFDGRLGWNPRSNQSQAERERQQWSGPGANQAQRPADNASRPVVTRIPTKTSIPKTAAQTDLSQQKSNSIHAPSVNSASSIKSSGSGSASQKARADPHIEKRTSIDQQSVRLNLERGESMSDRSSSVSSSEWKSSEFDISTLSPAKIAKLKKKGINPALYAEMQQARLGGKKKKSLISPLYANTFLS